MALLKYEQAKMKVFKFGGASVKNAAAVKNVGEVLKQFGGEEILVIVSAMGKITNALELLAKSYFEGSKEKEERYKQVKDFHDEIIKDLLKGSLVHTYDDIENLFIELECELETKPDVSYDKVYDQIVSYGEIFSSRIISAYLNEAGIKNRWMDARNFICIENNTYREGKLDWETTSNLIANKLKPIVRKQLVVTQGFIGKNKDNFTVTLGREGSDYSAAIFAYGLDAESVTIWKDVAGVMNADPKKFPDALKIDAISYPKAIEMAYYGATVIHPKTIQPLQSKHIPLYVKSFVNPSAEGTIVGVDKEKEVHLPTIISKGQQVLISMGSRDFSFIVEDNLSRIFNAFARHKIKINLMQSSAISFSVCADYIEGNLPGLIHDLDKDYIVKTNDGLELLTITNYQPEMLDSMILNREVLIEQRTRHTVQFVLK